MSRVRIPDAFKELFTPSRYKVYHGGRGGAKSHSFAAALLIMGTQRPLRILCGREVQDTIQESVKQLLDNKIKALGLSSFYDSLKTEIRGKNGTYFFFKGFNKLTEAGLKSIEDVDVLWVEEAQTIVKSTLEIIIPTIRKEASEIWFSLNRRDPSDPVDERFFGPNPPEDAIIRQVNYDQNPFFPDVLEKERLYDKKHNIERYDHIWEGDHEPSVTGAIWDFKTINSYRRDKPPGMEEIYVSIDHACKDKPEANEHGIIVGGKGVDGRGYILADLSMEGKPDEWAKKVIAAYHLYEADGVIVETNQGGDLVANTLTTIQRDLPIIEVTATRGKHVRAAPIASLYNLGKVSHIGALPELEWQMTKMTASGWEGPKDKSPDRLDAAVWLLSQIFPSLTMGRSEPEPEVYSIPHEQGWMG